MHQPSKIPTDMWQVFRQIDKIKEKITNNSAGNITAELQGSELQHTYLHIHNYMPSYHTSYVQM